MSRSLARIVLVVLIAAGTAGLPGTGRSAVTAAPVPAPCTDSYAELLRVLGELGEYPPDWTITDLDPPVAGRANLDTLTATIDRDAPCRYVAAVVRHEWMHLQQGRMYGGMAAADARYRVRGELELVADCGSMILGSTLTPYVDESVAETGVGCNPLRMAEARRLIAFDASDTPRALGATP